MNHQEEPKQEIPYNPTQNSFPTQPPHNLNETYQPFQIVKYENPNNEPPKEPIPQFFQPIEAPQENPNQNPIPQENLQENSINQNESNQQEGSVKRFFFCCKKCKTNHKHSNKTCVCVVPRGQRRIKLTQTGCRICGCKGCTKEDREFFDQIKEKKPKEKRVRKRSFDSKESIKSRSSYSREHVNLNNFQDSILIRLIQTYWRVYPPLVGVGIPERTESYILGKTKKSDYY